MGGRHPEAGDRAAHRFLGDCNHGPTQSKPSQGGLSVGALLVLQQLLRTATASRSVADVQQHARCGRTHLQGDRQVVIHLRFATVDSELNQAVGMSAGEHSCASHAQCQGARAKGDANYRDQPEDHHRGWCLGCTMPIVPARLRLARAHPRRFHRASLRGALSVSATQINSRIEGKHARITRMWVSAGTTTRSSSSSSNHTTTSCAGPREVVQRPHAPARQTIYNPFSSLGRA